MSPYRDDTESGGPSPDVLFDAMREGMVLCEAIRDEDGRVVDYWIRRANPAYLRGVGGKDIIGRRWREVRPEITQNWFDTCGRVLQRQKPERFEFHDPGFDRWFDAHLTPISKDLLAQFFVDVTHRKRAEAHQAELFHELNHRVKNNLMIVSAMLSMQSRASSNPEVRRELQQAVDRIQTISEVHSTLYRTGAVETVNFALYVETLCDRLSASLLDGRIALSVKTEAVTLPMGEAVQLGIILNELVTNAAKHAYPAPASGRVEVECRRGARGLELTVRDFGKGLPAGSAQSAGMGTRLVSSLVQQLHGELTLDGRSGVVAQLVLPERGAEPDRQPNLI